MSELKPIEKHLNTSPTFAQLAAEFEAEWENKTHEQREIERFAALKHSIKAFNEKTAESGIDDCPICHGKGYYQILNETKTDATAISCGCEIVRKSIRVLKESGLKDILTKNTFGNFTTSEKYQQVLKATALDYLDNSDDGVWFTVLGQSGAGKTHICTALCGAFIERGHSVRYFRWLDEGKKLKAMVNDAKYQDEVYKYKSCDVLYIDDFLKRKKNDAEPTDGDIKLAFEILNYRIDGGLRTIISCEDTLSRLLEIDEAIGGRIKRQAGKYLVEIAHSREKNHRLKTKEPATPETKAIPAYRDTAEGGIIGG